MSERVRRFRRLVCTSQQVDNDEEMRALLGELNLELGREPVPGAFKRVQRILLNTGGGIYDGEERLRNALSDLGLGGEE